VCQNTTHYKKSPELRDIFNASDHGGNDVRLLAMMNLAPKLLPPSGLSKSWLHV
jgi:hypothetical protein